MLGRVRVVFIGSVPEVAAAIVLGGHELAACVVVEGWIDRSRARWAPRGVRAVARERGAPVHSLRPDRRLPTALERLAIHGDALVCAGFPSRIPPSVLGRFRLGGLNVHPSLLPAHRGPDPVGRTLLAREASTGVTLHEMTDTLDAGPIVVSVPCPILPLDTRTALRDRLLALGALTIPRALRSFEQGDRMAVPEPGPLEPRLRSDEVRPDPDLSTLELDARIRAVSRIPGARMRDDRGLVHRVVGCAPLVTERSGRPGAVLDVCGPRVLMATRDGALWLALAAPPRAVPKRLSAA